MNRSEHLHLLGEKTALERMIAETPEEDVIDRASLTARLENVEAALAQAQPDQREPARVRVTFKGRPVIGSHGIFAEFGMKAVNSFAESVAAMAAPLTAPLAATGPIPNRDQHQLLITSTALGSFGFELEEYRTGQLTLGDGSAVAQALDRTQSLLRGTLGTDDELADSAAEADRRALDKVRAFLETLADDEAVCTLQFGDSTVSFSDVGQVRTSIKRLSQDNLREQQEELRAKSKSTRALLRNMAKMQQAFGGKTSHFPGRLDDGLRVMGAWSLDGHGEPPKTLYTGKPDIVLEVFNSPFGPDVLVTTDRLSEGVDLHRCCRHLIHYELDPSPVRTLQRNGRVRRVGSWAALTCQPICYAYPTFGGTRDERAVDVMRQRIHAFGLLLGGVPSLDDDSGDSEQSFAEAVVRGARKDLESLNRKLCV
jgi:Helicase conserved C-terminal domain